MSKNKKTLLALLSVTAVIAIVILIFVLTAPKETVSSEVADEKIYIYSVTRDEFSSAVITNPNGSYTLEKTSDGFSVKEVADYKQNVYSTDWVGEKLLELNASKRISSPAEDLSEYGLASPLATCKVLLTDGTTKTILLGNEAPSGGFYIKLQEESDVYIVNHSLPSYMNFIAPNFVDTDVIPSAEDYADKENANTTVSYVLLSGKLRDEDVEISMDPNYDGGDGTEASTPYIMTKPIIYDVNTTTAGDLINHVTQISFSSCIDVHITPEKLAYYRLDAPEYQLTYKFADSTVKISFSSMDDSTYYAILDGFDAVFTIAAVYVPYLSSPAEDYMTRLTFAESITYLSKLSVEADGNRWTFDVKHPEAGAVAYCNGVQLDQENFKRFYENLLMTLSEGRTTDVPTAASRLTITYSFNNGTDDVKVEFVPADAMRYVYLINGEGTFFVLKSQVDSIIADVARVAKNEEIKTTI